jgi:hypothetical protein
VAACFTDARRQDRIEHGVETLVAQRIHGIALGYEVTMNCATIRCWACYRESLRLAVAIARFWPESQR